ncbi:MAG: outer membrane lipoprotein-sorting protein [Microscillaceae bacterium]|nr:outer membrane lipoprotein-sorting protein [Microscillaceae bacterium]
MKNLNLVFVALLFVCASPVQAQSVDEIISNYFENTGGYAKWGELKNIKMSAKVNQGGLEIPLEIVQTAEGRQYTKINFQGQVIMQGVFDGETLWGTNFQTMKAEKADAEATEIQKLEKNDFPESLYNYKTKGYNVELSGKETMDGTETFKVKLTKEPITVDGQKVENITYYFFDVESFVLLAVESEIKSGPAKGMISQSKMSDYQEVNGLYFPFKLTQGVKGQGGQAITLDAIELNVEVNEKDFAYPDGE